jgi:uncharacterized OB-fold protein
MSLPAGAACDLQCWIVHDRAEASAPRILPALTALNTPYWTGGANGELLIQRCPACRVWLHPPVERCPACAGRLRFEPVSGNGTIFTFTHNSQQFHPEVPPPYVIAIVELDEQADLRLPTNIVNCDPDLLSCGMPVRVLFERQDPVFVPVFEPAAGGGAP